MKKIISVLLLLTLLALPFSLPTQVKAQSINCPSIDELAQQPGWQYLTVIDGGWQCELSQDGDLPWGFEAIGENGMIFLEDTYRLMQTGTWSVYRLCGSDSIPEPDVSCPSYDDLDFFHQGWISLGSTEDGFGHIFQLSLADSLPWGYEAVSEMGFISLDNPDRTMAVGVWSVYRFCEFGFDFLEPVLDCPTYENLDERRGWFHLGPTEDGFGQVFRVTLKDSLPWGFEAISEIRSIFIQDQDRNMYMSIWSVYRLCGQEVPPPADDCPTFDMLDERLGWQLLNITDDFEGRVFQLVLDDSLPHGFEAVSENKTIFLDTQDRFMPMGVWSVWRVACGIQSEEAI